MKKEGLLTASAIPGVVFGYALLVGILMKRITPVPIVAMPGGRKTAAAPPAHLRKREPAAV
ncbi:MAG: hypothetical protein ACRD3M_10675 [Thermoanaerobaculia bacterium]